ncbi:unnamed protein product [Moneuplotes crassus]|uniref:Uncharacterized protein n=2 Tax=Euplotes crassus TaxID=5936 RepID=A0AAD1UGY8_EUPCR|nr:unnamed protein product [Moneuplotes crassus]
MKYILIAVALIALAMCEPEHPRWPTKFSMEFDEKFTYGPLSDETHGTFYYDAASGRYKVERDNGRYDRYCGWNGIKIIDPTPCTHYVDEEGDRYLYYPTRKECCYCCSAEHGCGILRQNWQQGAAFEGEIEFNGYPAYKWDKKGLQSNLYIETIAENPDDRIMLNIDQKPNDSQTFDPDTYETDFPDKKLEKPSICQKSHKCSLLSVCTGVRHGFS